MIHICNINPNSMGGGLYTPFSKILEKKCPFSRNDNTALIKQISMFDTALVMKNT